MKGDPKPKGTTEPQGGHVSTPKKSGRTTPKKEKKITSAKDWKKSSGAGDLDLPSGNTCLVRRPGVMTFVQQGLVPNSLMGIMNKAADGNLPDKDLQKGLGEILEDPKKMQDMLQMVDAITLYCVVQPKVYPISKREEIMADDSLTPEEQLNQLDNLMFIDEVDEEDKMFIFQWAVGGDRNVDRFRDEQSKLLESLPTSEDVAVPAKRAAGTKKR